VQRHGDEMIRECGQTGDRKRKGAWEGKGLLRGPEKEAFEKTCHHVENMTLWRTREHLSTKQNRKKKKRSRHKKKKKEGGGKIQV